MLKTKTTPKYWQKYYCAKCGKEHPCAEHPAMGGAKPESKTTNQQFNNPTGATEGIRTDNVQNPFLPQTTTPTSFPQ